VLAEKCEPGLANGMAFVSCAAVPEGKEFDLLVHVFSPLVISNYEGGEGRYGILPTVEGFFSQGKVVLFMPTSGKVWGEGFFLHGRNIRLEFDCTGWVMDTENPSDDPVNGSVMIKVSMDKTAFWIFSSNIAPCIRLILSWLELKFVKYSMTDMPRGVGIG
jgi:hypothetical protein